MGRRPRIQAVIQESIRSLARITLTVYFRLRVHGLPNYPPTDGFLICSNHQSHLDPVVLGSICPRPINMLGRDTLTRLKPFGWLLYFLDLIAIDREGGGLAGIKETLRRLRKQETVLMFPEGTRTRDGNLQPLKPGFTTIARKIKAPVVPIAADGGFQAMPRNSLLVRPVRIHVVIGKPIEEPEYRDLSDEEFVNLVSCKIQECLDEARWRRNR
jgi:1-acyl-sn-glycerol-3-phosphate acyltransferase